LNEGLLWLWDGPKVAAAQTSIPLTTILTRVLNAAAEIKRNDAVSTERTRQIALNTRDALRARRYARFKEALEEMDPGVAAALRTQINRLDNLGRVTDDLDKLIRTRFPQLIITPVVQPKWKEESVLYATRAGKDRKHTEMEQLAAKIRENAVAIGKAAELGDLSENSEYKFALEERDLLNARMSQLTKEMDMARLLTPEEVPTDRVGIGCRVIAEHTETGERQELTILGPWEANHEQNVFNYRTPLAQAILGTPVGETADVEFFDPPGTYRIVEVASAME
jgi:transcription elongation GreA/GreB family factor